MFNNSELIEQLEVEVITAKKASLMGKAKAVETCVDSLVALIKLQESQISANTLIVKLLDKKLTSHIRTGK